MNTRSIAKSEARKAVKGHEKAMHGKGYRAGGKTSLEMKKVGEVLRWVINDVMKEETDTMIKNGIEPKEVNKYLSAKAKELFVKKLQNIFV